MTEQKKKGRGGARIGAGAKPIGEKTMEAKIQVRVSAEQYEVFKQQGGNHWFRSLLTNPSVANNEMIDGYDRNEFLPIEIVRSASIPMGFSPVQAGFPSPAEQYKDKGIDFNELLIDNEASTFVLRARGESMVEAGIDKGDLLVVDRSREERVGDIVIMQVNNEFTVKRLLKDAKGLVYLHPESHSPLYSDIYPNENDEWICFGVVRHVIKSLGK